MSGSVSIRERVSTQLSVPTQLSAAHAENYRELFLEHDARPTVCHFLEGRAEKRREPDDVCADAACVRV